MPFSVFRDYEEFIPFAITNEPKQYEGLTTEARNLLRTIHPFLEIANLELVKTLEDYVHRYPDIPIFKSHLYVAYQRVAQRRNAKRILSLMQEKHPDYLFGKINMAGQQIGRKSGTSIRKLLGEELWLHKLLPEQEVFHESEVLAYYNVVIRQLLEEGNLREAMERQKVLILAFPGAKETMDNVLRISLKKMQTDNELFDNDKKRRLAPKVFSKVAEKYPATREMPVFENERINAFYKYGIEDFPAAVIETLTKADRASLSRDVERVVVDAIKRYEYFEKKTRIEQIDNICLLEHALILSVAFRLTGVIPTLLDLFRSGKEPVDYWLTSKCNFYCQELLALGFPVYKDQYLKFVCENNVYAEGKTIVAAGVSKATICNAELREEGILWFLEVFDFFAKHSKDKSLIDTDVINLLLNYSYHIKDERFLKPLQFAHERNWIYVSIIGTLEEGRARLQQPYDCSLPEYSHIPTELAEYYKIEKEDSEELLPHEDSEEDVFEAYYEKVLMHSLSGDGGNKVHSSSSFFPQVERPNERPAPYQQQGTVINKEKVGRNDPCPCGSGKKYKHCCMRK